MIALVLLPALVAVAAAQPVVVREQLVSERADAQAFVLFDTSLSMRASAATGPGDAARAREAARSSGCSRALSDVPIGIASMTDRSLPNLMPTTDSTLFDRTVAPVDRDQRAAAEPAVQDARDDVRRARPARRVPLLLAGRAAAAAHRLHRRRVVAGLAAPQADVAPPGRPRCSCTSGSRASGSSAHGRADRRYVSDPQSKKALDDLAEITGSTHSFEERDFGAISRAARDAVGRAGTRTHIDSYARIALAPWFVLAGALPLGVPALAAEPVTAC